MTDLLELEKKILCEHYVTLSELESCFGKTSKHKAVQIIDKKMRQLLLRINEVENKLSKSDGKKTNSQQGRF